MNNQLTTLNSLDIAKPAQFAALVAQVQAMQAFTDEFWKIVNQQMLERGITSLKGDYGLITTAERINWKVDFSTLPDYYVKPAADTKKLKAAFDAGETVPGADFSTTVYMSKRLKQVEA